LAALPIDRVTGKSVKQGMFGYSVAGLVYHAVFSYCQEWVPNVEEQIGCQWIEMNAKAQREGINIDALLAKQRPLAPGEARDRLGEFISRTFDVDGAPSVELEAGFRALVSGRTGESP